MAPAHILRLPLQGNPAGHVLVRIVPHQSSSSSASQPLNLELTATEGEQAYVRIRKSQTRNAFLHLSPPLVYSLQLAWVDPALWAACLAKHPSLRLCCNIDCWVCLCWGPSAGLPLLSPSVPLMPPPPSSILQSHPSAFPAISQALTPY